MIRAQLSSCSRRAFFVARRQQFSASTLAESNTDRPDFDNVQTAYASKSTAELVRAALVYNLCNVSYLVKNAEPLLNLSRTMVGDTLTDIVLRNTLFGHFCAGENEDEIRPVLRNLQSHGVNGILDYAAESDIIPSFNNGDYDESLEKSFDEHVNVFRSCIQSVHNVDSDGFAAVKVTALGNPKLLERMSLAIVEARKLFAKFDSNGDGLIGREEFEQGYKLFFKDRSQLSSMMDYLDQENTGTIDYITWSKLLTPSDLPNIVSSCRQLGPLARASLTNQELELMDRMFERAKAIAEEAVRCQTRVLLDAEQCRYQPAIDNLVLGLQQTYNATDATTEPIIFNTYQCYLKDAVSTIRTDVERSERFGYHFGAKLVRGAYMESERALAKAHQRPSPIHDTAHDTHACYNDAVEYLLKHSIRTDQQNVQIMCATHNQESIERAMHIMNELGIQKDSGTIRFAQLHGMSDNLTFNLAANGYLASKYVPYGSVKEVMPYLLRRAQENSAMLGSANRELEFLKKELVARLGWRFSL